MTEILDLLPLISADTKALYDVIGFKPETTVKDGVKNFVDWYRGFYKV